MLILPISAAETIPLRHAVLRPGLPRETAIFECDDRAVHFGALRNGELLAVATLQCEALPGIQKTAWRLRGMATAAHTQSQGIGTALLTGCVDYIRQRGAEILWCTARTTALHFYQRNGFETVGEEFEIPGVGPHFVMIKTL